MELIRLVMDKFLLVEEKIFKLLDGSYTYPEFEQELKEVLSDLGKDVCQDVLNELDEKIYKDKDKRKDWKVVQKGCKRTIVTPFGDVNYERRYYKNKSTGKRAYLLDNAIGIEKHERIDTALRADIVDISTNLSYQKTKDELTRYTGKASLSRQTVMNTIRKTKQIASNEKVNAKKTVNTLYIEADEDHIHLQNGKSCEVKLVYVHEGKKETLKGRYALKNPMYFSGIYEKEKLEDLWEKVWEYIKDTYEEDKIERIYIFGDGAKWIKFGVDYLPNTVYVLDLFHLQKYITSALKDDKKSKKKLLKAIFKKDIQTVNDILNEKLKTQIESKDQIEKCITYVNSNLDGILSYSIYNNEIIGCSAESHVSHVLSERLSRGPISWSKAGAHKMGKLRAAKASGISVKDAILKERYKSLEPISLLPDVISYEKQKLKKATSMIRAGGTSLPILNYKKSFTSDAIKSLLESCNI